VRESIQSLRTAMIFADKAKPTSTVLFTSATPKEGKSSTMASLGRALAAGGERTILLDCDFRLPTLSHIFQVPRDRGIATYLLDEEDSWRRHIQENVAEGLDFFPTGPLPPNPTDVLVSPRLATLFGLLAQEYNWILVDSPPATSMSDAVLLADRVDGVVFVVRYDHADQRTVGRAMASLESVGARILGAVLNAVDTRKPGYRDYFYGRYAYHGEAQRRTVEEEKRSFRACPGEASKGQRLTSRPVPGGPGAAALTIEGLFPTMP
jgi:capsular exopolysaccharide synthesis family protein